MPVNPNDVQPSINALLALLQRQAFDYVDETACQIQIANYLNRYGIPFEREYSLTPRDRIDFFFPRSGIGLEIKANKRWQKRKVLSQLTRYAEHDSITALILATGAAQAVPEVINGKPCRIHHLGAAHL